MQVVILTAGQGTRMRPLTSRRPKPMLPVGDRPLAAHAADAAVRAGAEEFVFVVGYESQQVVDYFGDSYRGVPVEYAHQDEQDGTAHAVEMAVEHLDGSFVVLNGDTVLDPSDLETLLDAAPAVGATRVERPSNYGVFETDGDQVTAITEKPDNPPSDLVNVGAYAFPDVAQDWLSVPYSDRGERELTDVLERVVGSFEVTAVEFSHWMDVGRPWELLAANEAELETVERRLDGDVSADASVNGDVVVEAGATIREGSVVDGPALIRAGATVGPNAYVRGATLVGEDATVGHAVEVKNSVLMEGATVGHLSYVGDSVLGPDVNFGAGTTVANLRHDGEAVETTVKGERVSTGRRKFGAVVGPEAATGINTSLDAGARLGAGDSTYPNQSIRSTATNRDGS